MEGGNINLYDLVSLYVFVRNFSYASKATDLQIVTSLDGGSCLFAKNPVFAGVHQYVGDGFGELNGIGEVDMAACYLHQAQEYGAQDAPQAVHASGIQQAAILAPFQPPPSQWPWISLPAPSTWSQCMKGWKKPWNAWTVKAEQIPSPSQRPRSPARGFAGDSRARWYQENAADSTATHRSSA